MIGITGGYGSVGCRLTRELIATTSYSVLIGGRDACRARELACELGERAFWQQVDVENQKSLDVFCAGCELVVNCAGPSRDVRDKVALSALRGSAHYLDASGEEPLRDMLAGRSSDIREEGLSFILSAGTYPGLSALFPSYLARRCFDTAHSAELFFHFGDSRLSLNAALDIVAYVSGFNCGMETIWREGSFYYEGGQILSGALYPYFADFPEPVGRILVHPVFTGEMYRFAQQVNLRKLRAFIAYSEAMLRALIAVRTETYTSKEQERFAAERLVAASGYDVSPYTMYHVVMDGVCRGKKETVHGTLLYRGDHMMFVAKVLAAAARLVLGGKSRPGVSFLAEGVEPSQLMALLDKDVSVTITDQDRLRRDAGTTEEKTYAF